MNRATITILLCIGLTACEEDRETCDNIRCDAECRIGGLEFGYCTGPYECTCGYAENCHDGLDNDIDGAIDCYDSDCGYQGISELSCTDGLDNDCDGDVDCYDIADCGSDPACGGCDNATCNSDCISSGWTGGVCVSDACQCTDDCTSHDQCPALEVCYHGSCEDPWSRLYRFTVVGGTLPERQWWDDECYDIPCGPPDVQVSLTVGSDTCTTTEAPDTFTPTWNEYCDLTVTSSTTMEWTMWDLDLTSDDVITYADPMFLTVDYIRAGGVQWSVDYLGTEYIILQIWIDPA